MTNSRNKGSAFERAVAKDLFAELGISFKRDLEQYRERDRGDLIPSDSAFPFLLECKHYASGTDCKPAWEVQAFKAAQGTQLHPCVVWTYNRQPVRYRVWFDALAEAFGSTAVSNKHADLTIQGFAWICREIMAQRAVGAMK